MEATYDIIRRPLDTEKLDKQRDAQNQYAFEIDRRATKLDVKRAVEQAFKVKVLTVRTMIVRGHIKRLGRSEGQRPNWKKALVTLKEGDAISLFEGK